MASQIKPWQMTRLEWIASRGAIVAEPNPEDSFEKLVRLGHNPAVADWEARDLDDSVEFPDAESVRSDYPRQECPGRRNDGCWPDDVYRAYVRVESLDPVLGYDDDEDYDWDELEEGVLDSSVPPAKLRLDEDGDWSIPDGNHRVTLWERKSFSHVPAWVLDYGGHRRLVEAAMARGDDVPEAVLREYRVAAQGSVGEPLSASVLQDAIDRFDRSRRGHQ